ncbi:pre-rRNA-processing protein TSR2-like [Heracleum sosnowskyi]|uniref:Pre-rRNA-processing protein TSR2-like n=1 Tax=Heracleum sosnowskyi TaxID=360622 RepID=A0AAD8IBZ2_9APIA|nr:pre-rRNA-processing protein TSR2-like [Heracleum sosnowskyi]
MERHQLSEEAAYKLQEGIQLLLSQWSSLQVAVENEFGGPDSRRKSQQLPVDLFSWFTQSKGPIYIDDLENMLDDFMLSLNTELDDGSIEEISENLMIMHEECLEGNFMSIERLKDAPRVSVQHINQDASSDENSDGVDYDESSTEKHTEMGVDASKSQPNGVQDDMMVVDEPLLEKTTEAQDGWTVVPSRRSKGRRN